MKKWKIDITDPSAAFNQIDTNHGGMILFDEFCQWAIKKNLDLEDDDDLLWMICLLFLLYLLIIIYSNLV